MTLEQLERAYDHAKRIAPTLADKALQDHGGNGTPESVPTNNLDDCTRALRRIGGGSQASASAKPTLDSIREAAYARFNNPPGFKTNN